MSVSLVLLIRLAVSNYRAYRLSSMATPHTSILNSTPVAYCEQIDVPVTTGLFFPKILLPFSTREWGDSRSKIVLGHEAAHVMRRDVLWQMIASVSRSLVWFQPLAWLGHRQMILEREKACDDLVLENGVLPIDDASELLALATSVRDCRPRLLEVVSVKTDL